VKNKLKIIHVIPSLAKGGAERLVLDTVIALSKINDIEASIITFSPINDFTFLSDSIEYNIIPAKVIPSIKGKTKNDIEKLQSFIEKSKADVIHLHLFESVMVFSQIRYENCKYIIHFHDNMKQFSKLNWMKIRKKEQITNAYERRIVLQKYLQRNTTCIGISYNTYNFIQKNLPLKIKKTILHNGIDTSRFDSKKTIKDPRLITIGSLLKNKNHILIIQIVKILHDKNYKIELDIIGDGPESKYLIEQIKYYNLEKHVHLLGKVDYPESYLTKSSLYIHTALNEAFGLVLIEAMASGLPVICTDAGGNRDIIEHGKNGFIFKNRNPELMANQIIELIENKEQIESIGKYAQQYAQQFDIKNYVNQLIELYRT
jgi:glycosyltransferase involved in cell wall biosynthesis